MMIYAQPHSSSPTLHSLLSTYINFLPEPEIDAWPLWTKLWVVVGDSRLLGPVVLNILRCRFCRIYRKKVGGHKEVYLALDTQLNVYLLREKSIHSWEQWHCPMLCWLARTRREDGGQHSTCHIYLYKMSPQRKNQVKEFFSDTLCIIYLNNQNTLTITLYS